MKWVVGVDLLPDSEGAVELVAWLHQQGGVGEREVGGLCVLDEGAFFTVRGDARRRVEEGVREALVGFAESSSAALALGDLEARIASPVHEALGTFARDRRAVLVVGRQAPRAGGGALVRLGKVARRLLRRLPVPVTIVPPDLKAKDLPGGPVLVALDTSNESMAAFSFARAYAKAVRRPVRVVHVLPTVGEVGLEYLSPQRAAELRHEYAQSARAKFEDFTKAHEIRDVELSLLPGPVVEAILEVAAGERACGIVCGSRLLGVAARMLSASIGSELAAAAPIPVTVVPPDWEQ